MDENNSPLDDQASVFDLSLEDDDLLKLVEPAVTESQDYWNGNDMFNLAETSKDNLNMWLGKYWQKDKVYEHQQENLYVDNRVFTSVETIVEMVNSNIARPEVFPAKDTLTSIQLAKDIQTALTAHGSKHGTIDLYRANTRNMMLKRRAYLKLRWDPTFGKQGDIVPELLDPNDVVVDKDATMFSNPRFVAHKLKGKTVEELTAMFEGNEQKIYEAFGFSRRDKKGDRVAYKTQMRQQKDVWEIWFTYWEDKQPKEAVLWCDLEFRFVLAKIRNPNYNYEDEGFDEQEANYFDMPRKPFIPFNHLNDGSSAVDLTSLPEQASSPQRILNKRGFQIMENADQAGGGMVFNTMMITKEDMAKLIGSPDERIGVKGPVTQAIARVEPPLLPPYVMEDKYDARNEIDNIFGTHAISRGESSDNVTLGQDIMQQDKDTSRQEGLARAIERASVHYYRYLVQMMKVYYTEDHWFKATGEDGQFDFVVMKSDLIEDGVEVNVEVGSTLPIDKQSLRESAMELASAGLMDPLTLYETLGLPNPKKLVERLMKFTTDPMSFMQDIETEQFDREAMMDVMVLNTGEAPKLRSEYKPTYFNYMNNYMLTGEFSEQPDIVQQLYVEHLRVAQAMANKQMMAMMTQMPTQQDMDSTNAQAIKNAEAEGALMGGGAQSDVPDQGQEVANQVAEQQAKEQMQAQGQQQSAGTVI